MRYLPMISLPMMTLLAVTLTGCATSPKSDASRSHKFDLFGLIKHKPADNADTAASSESKPETSTAKANEPQSHKFDLFGLIKYKPESNENAVVNNSTLKTIDYANTNAHKNRFRIDPFSVGAWVNQKQGDVFRQVTPTDPKSAIVYLYRPFSSWNREEIVAPNFFLNDKRIPSLLNNHYYWVELPEGTYRLNISRPVGVIHFQKGTAVDFAVEAGKTYFLKYEEQRFRGAPNNTEGLLKAGPLIQMPTQQALTEISSTTLKTPGFSFVKRDTVDRPELAVFNGKQPNAVSKKQLAEKPPLYLNKPFKIWNPLTW